MRLILLLLVVFLLSCSRESEEPLWEPQSHLSGKVYNGGLFPVWITLKEPVSDASAIEWRRLRGAEIAKRTQAIDPNTNLIKADTAFLYWETAPQPTIVITAKDSNKTDTAYYYRDTVFAIVNGKESLPIVIEVKNILPRITGISINGLEQPGDSVLTIAAHPGGNLKIEIRLEKPFNKSFHAEVTMPEIMNGLITKSKSDSLWVYEWTPNEIIADSSVLKIKDSGAYGERLYKLRIVVYTESGSVWVASANELIKYSPTGTEVARIKDDFNSISALTLNSKDGTLFVTDESQNFIAIYNTHGKQLYKNNNFQSPTGVAFNVEGRNVWVADRSGLQRFPFDGNSLGTSDVPNDDILGIIEGLAVNQFESDLTWFAIPKNDIVGYVEDLTVKYLTYSWQRPSMVSLAPASGIAWVADSSRVVAIDTSGKVWASIKGFRDAYSVSASGSSVWVSDRVAGKVYRFAGPFRGNLQDTILTVANGIPANYEFQRPVSVSAFTSDGSVWIVDRDAGKTVRLDSLGRVTASGTGLTLPNLNVTLQKVD